MMEFSAAKDGLLVFFQSQNVGAVRIDGLELNGYYSFTQGDWTLNGLFGLTIIDPTYLDWDATGNGQQVTDTSLTLSQLNAAKSTSDENILKYRNRVNAKVDLEARWKGWSTGVNLNRTSEMQAIDRVLTLVIPGMIEDDRVRLEGSDLWALDWRLGYNWADYQILFSVKNIGDVRYWSRPGYLEAPRTYTLRWGARF
jgi:outer membrane receptor protein involved in Fe transport